MLGLPAGRIQLSQYTSEWRTLFLEEEARLKAHFGGYILDTQHIGSTSIPGMAAKPILDIGVAVKNFEEAARCVPPMEQLGYTYKGENGIPRRHYFVKGNPRTHHVHMFESESDEWRNHLLFRDYMIDNPKAARGYARLKEDLAKKFANDREAYQAGKDDFIKAVLDRAREGRVWK